MNKEVTKGEGKKWKSGSGGRCLAGGVIKQEMKIHFPKLVMKTKHASICQLWAPMSSEMNDDNYKK